MSAKTYRDSSLRPCECLLQSTTYQGLPLPPPSPFSNVVMARKRHLVILVKHLPTEQMSAVCGGMAGKVGQVAEERIPQAAIAYRANGNVRSCGRR